MKYAFTIVLFVAERFHLTLHHEREMAVIAMRPGPVWRERYSHRGRCGRLHKLAGCDLNAQRDVGMTLHRAKAVVDILVVDHADKVPTEN